MHYLTFGISKYAGFVISRDRRYTHTQQVQTCTLVEVVRITRYRKAGRRRTSAEYVQNGAAPADVAIDNDGSAITAL